MKPSSTDVLSNKNIDCFTGGDTYLQDKTIEQVQYLNILTINCYQMFNLVYFR